MNQSIDLSAVAGIPVWLHPDSLTLEFGEGITSEPVAQRRSQDIAAMLPEPVSDGPDPLYSIYMNVHVPGVSDELLSHGLALGAVVDAHGTIGREFVHSQGHVHSCPPDSDQAYLEIYEIWHGRGVVYMQDKDTADVTEVAVVPMSVGDKLVIPPGWVHVVVSTGDEPLVFGALYATEATLLYDQLRAMQGTAWRFLSDGTYERNPGYGFPPEPHEAHVGAFPNLGIVAETPMMAIAEKSPDIYVYVSDPEGHPDAVEAITTLVSRPS